MKKCILFVAFTARLLFHVRMMCNVALDRPAKVGFNLLENHAHPFFASFNALANQLVIRLLYQVWLNLVASSLISNMNNSYRILLEQTTVPPPNYGLNNTA